MNDAGLIVGDYLPFGKSTYKTFSYFNGKYSDLNVPGPVFALSNDGTVGGQYPSNTGYHGFTMKNGVVTTYDFPGGTNTAINNFGPGGSIFGIYQLGNTYESFEYLDGHYYPLFGPNKSAIYVFSVSPEKGNLTGFYNEGAFGGFLAVCPPRHSPCTQ